MKKYRLDNVYESYYPPTDTKVLWLDKDKTTGEIRAIHRYKNGGWEPYLVSVEYLKKDSDDSRVTEPLEEPSKGV